MTRKLVATGLVVVLGGSIAVGAMQQAEQPTLMERNAMLRQQLKKERKELDALKRIAAPILRPTPEGNRALARAYFGNEFNCASEIITGETGGTWRHDVAYGFRYGEGLIYSGLPYGLGQANPGTKMFSAGKDAAGNPLTQLVWFKDYAVQRYNSVCGASAHWTPTRSW